MRFIVLLAILLCLPHLGAGRRVIKRGPGGKEDGNALDDGGFEDELDDLEEETPDWDPKAVKEKCADGESAEAKANCVCHSAEGEGLSQEEVTKRCQSLRMTLMYLRAFPWSCKHPVGGVEAYCRPFDPHRARNKGTGGGSDGGPEEKVSDEGNIVNDDENELDFELEDDATDKAAADKAAADKAAADKAAADKAAADKAKLPTITVLCAKLCLPFMDKSKKGCEFYPPFSYEGDKDEKFCLEKCGNREGVCVDIAPPGNNNPPVVVEERQQEEKDDPVQDDEEFDEEELGESEEVLEEKKKEPTLTCSKLVKSSTPHTLTTQAQLRAWCGGDRCGKKLKMRPWAICELADGQVVGPSHGGQIQAKTQNGFDCYINCEGQAEVTTSALTVDCISSPGGWGSCSRGCGGGMQRQQLAVAAYPTNGGKNCPVPPTRGCNTHRCPAPPPPDDCFPADALVETSGGTKAMSDLRVGDRIRSVDGAGKPIYDEVYFFGHADGSRSAEYVDLKLPGNLASLQLSKRHFLPTCPQHGKHCDWTEHIHSYAEEVLPGDYIWVAQPHQDISLQMVVESSFVMKEGLYNPYTLSGKVVVNGVVASAHSDWILDQWIPSSMSRYLPAVYQVMFLPGRLLYELAGTSAADALDVNNPQLAAETHGNGPEFLGFCFFGLLAIGATLRRKTKA